MSQCGENDNKTTNDLSLKENLALHVALQTMKERCQSLQNRLSIVENENLTLRMKIGLDKPTNDSDTEQSEVDLLKEKVAELTRQKFQLSDHIAMVATENRQLWSRLSKLTKDNETLGNSLNKIKDSIASKASSSTLKDSDYANTTHQILIRSKTFTQNSPNPLLRQKMNLNEENSIENLSLEEISLQILNDFLHGKAEIEKKCNETTNTTSQLINNSNNNLFGYSNDEVTDGTIIGGGLGAAIVVTDLPNDTKKCLDGVVDIKREILRQQSDLKVALSSLRQRRAILEICSICKNHPSTTTVITKPQTADKSLSTDNEIEMKDPSEAIQDIKSSKDEILSTMKFVTVNTRTDFVEEKRMADTLDKICPMCGKIYSNSISFNLFQDHVEAHFIDDSELDMSYDKNYEFVSHTVGNF